MFDSGIGFLEMLADPVVQAGIAAVAGGILLRWFLQGHPAHALVLRLGFLIVVTAVAIRSGNAPYDPSPVDAAPLHRFFIGATKFVWWTTAAWFTAACVRVFLRFDGQAREVRVIQDLIVGVIYVGAVLSIIAYVFGAPVGTLLATSGVVAIILGLALQSTLGDLFSGIAINAARPFSIGDWIVLSDGTEGRVIEMNWRATHLLNGKNDLVVLPNAQLAKSTVTNRSGPDRSHGASLTLRFASDRRPSMITEVMQNALLSSTAILQAPPPSVHVTALDADAVTVELSFRVSDFARAGKAKSELLDLVFIHAKAADLRFASKGEQASIAAPSADLPRRPTPMRLLEALPLFASLNKEEREALAPAMTRRAHRRGEVLATAGDVLTSLLIVRSGVVSVEAGGRADIRLAPGDYFGEAGMLMQEPETATYRALSHVVLYEIGREPLQELIANRPGIAEELAQHLAQRTEKLGRNQTPSAPIILPQGLVARFVDRILAALPRTH